VVVAVLLLVAGAANTSRIGISPQQQECQQKCGKFFTLSQFEKINDSWSACVHGCEFYSRLERRVRDQPINTLQNCNYSCDERYGARDMQACEAGCGFGFDVANKQPKPSPRIEVQTSGRPGFISLNLPGIFDHLNKVMPKINEVMERTFPNPFSQEYEFSMPAMPQLPRISERLFGQKDNDHVEHIFDNFFGSVDRMMKNAPAMPTFDNLNAWSPFSMLGGGGMNGGKMTVIKSGPGYLEEKHYDIKPDGKIVQVAEERSSDALEHENPLEENFVDSNVEIIKPESVEQEKEADVVVGEKKVEKEEEKEMVQEGEEVPQPLVEVIEPELKAEEEAERNQFLSVIRNSIEDSDRRKQEYISQFRNAYMDDNSCSSEHIRWSDWVACVHTRLGVPRWLTAATIAFGIIFSVWMCLVIPSSAPKQRIRELTIQKLSRPSAAVSKEMTAAEAKEAEATASREPVVAVIKVDLPPSYVDVTPGSPAPSYKSDMAPPGSPTPSCKSDMAPPGSPAPSYKSVDVAVKQPVEKDLEEPIDKKESNA